MDHLENKDELCQKLGRTVITQVKVPSIEINEPETGTVSTKKRSIQRWCQLQRQYAQSESIDHEADLDSGLGASFSSSVSSRSDYGSFDRNLSERNTPSDVSDGRLEDRNEVWGKQSLDVPNRQPPRTQLSQASSGFWGESDDVEDPLNLSSASSVFAETDTRPLWQQDCENLIKQLTTDRLSSLIAGANSVSDVCEVKNQTSDCSVRSTDLLISDTSCSGSLETPPDGMSGPMETDCVCDSLVPVTGDSNRAMGLVVANLCKPRKARKPKDITTSQIRCKLWDCLEAQYFLVLMDRCFHLGTLPHCTRCDGTLHNVLDHNRTCQESHCSMPFCRAITQRRTMLGRHLGIEEVKGEVSIAGKLSVMEQMSATIHSFPGAQIPDSDIAKDACEFHPFHFLGDFGKFNVLLARLKRNDNQHSTVVIKQLTKRETLLPALQIIQGLDCDNWVNVIDLVDTEAHLFVISDFVKGLSFQEILETEGDWDWQIPFEEVVSALSFLHQHNILFLNWDSDNIIYGKPTTLLISQGSLTLIPDGAPSVKVDATLLEGISPRIAAPEVRNTHKQSISYRFLA
ncbi:hypothetical protein BSL78_12851 [Apostichopus japonicus]|uniref:Protein kinase domain-containing protein n=1 Tax=Stichopus japonicus TaxID=307972 RepID=A0A2G8KQJ6_STIJA|nr:hypothetical protein BSL78_12851 [Apostichopus japonicus]